MPLDSSSKLRSSLCYGLTLVVLGLFFAAWFGGSAWTRELVRGNAPGDLAEITTFIRGDANGDGKVNVTDALITLGYLFLKGERPNCFDAADANDDGKINIHDPITT